MKKAIHQVFSKEDLKGKRGIAQTVLRPGGKIIIEGQLYDAYTLEVKYIEKGQEG